MKYVFSVLIIFSFMTGIASAYSISGYIHNSKTGEAIPGVNVIVKNGTTGASSDLNGFFIIQGLPDSEFVLIFSHIAFRKIEKTVDMNHSNQFLGKIELEPRVIPSRAIEVTAKRNEIIQKDTDISSFQIDPIVLVETPQFSRDVFKLMQFSPSVTISDPYSPQFFVRGSDPGENLVLLDGMTIYNPQHFMASEAVFNPYSIKNIELLVGGFDAEYGGRNASILNISTREGNRYEVHGEFKPSTSGIVGAIEFPVRGESTAMLSARFISDLAFRVMMGVPNLMADVNAAYLTNLKNTRLRLSAFYARDYMKYNIDALIIYFPDTLFEDFSEGFTTNTSNHAFGFQTRTLLTPLVLLETQVYHSGSSISNKTFFSYTIKDDSSITDASVKFDTYIENSVNDFTIKTGCTYFAPFSQALKIGMELNSLSLETKTGTGRTQINRKNPGLQAFYLQDKVEYGDIILKLGYRFTRFADEPFWRSEPRVSAAIRFSPFLSIKLAAGEYNQYLTTMNSRNDEFVQYLDYYASLRGRPPISSRHYIAGMEGNITESLEYSLSVYFKDLKRLYRYEYAGVPFYQENGRSLEAGKGKSYGLEFLIRGEIGALSGWMSYSYSRGFRSYSSIMNGKWIVYDADQPHNFKTVLLYKLTSVITASAVFRFTSGYPKTWETGMLSLYQYDSFNNSLTVYPANITPAKNNVRFPPYMNLDLGWKKLLRRGFGYYLAEYLGAEGAVLTVMFKNILFLHRDPKLYLYFPGYGYYGLDPDFLPSMVMSYTIRF